MRACRSVRPPNTLDGEAPDLRVMIVEDFPQIRSLIRSILREFGTPMIEEAGNARDAAIGLPHFEPDVLLLDWHLNAGNGFALTKMIRDRSRSPDPYLPIIMITGFATPERIVAARDAGVTEFIRKPFTADTVARRVRSAIADERPYVNAARYFGPDRRRQSFEYAGPERRAPHAFPTIEIIRTKFNGKRCRVTEIQAR